MKLLPVVPWLCLALLAPLTSGNKALAGVTYAGSESGSRAETEAYTENYSNAGGNAGSIAGTDAGSMTSIGEHGRSQAFFPKATPDNEIPAGTSIPNPYRTEKDIARDRQNAAAQAAVNPAAAHVPAKDKPERTSGRSPSEPPH